MIVPLFQPLSIAHLEEDIIIIGDLSVNRNPIRIVNNQLNTGFRFQFIKEHFLAVLSLHLLFVYIVLHPPLPQFHWYLLPATNGSTISLIYLSLRLRIHWLGSPKLCTCKACYCSNQREDDEEVQEFRIYKVHFKRTKEQSLINRSSPQWTKQTEPTMISIISTFMNENAHERWSTMKLRTGRTHTTNKWWVHLYNFKSFIYLSWLRLCLLFPVPLSWCEFTLSTHTAPLSVHS